MRNIVAIDIGNTNVTLGIFKGRRLARKAKLPTNESRLYKKSIKRFLRRDRIDTVIISSVVPQALPIIKRVVYDLTGSGPAVIGKDIEVPIRNLYRVKRQVGQDRLVNAFAAKALYGVPAIVIDFGTAITFDIVSAEGEYLGGLILPGIELSLSGLYEKTALLPKVDLAPSRNIIGKDTADSMRAGILFGFGAMCDGLAARYGKMVGADMKVVATGGNAGLMKRYARSIRVVDEDLTLKGLRLLSPR